MKLKPNIGKLNIEITNRSKFAKTIIRRRKNWVNLKIWGPSALAFALIFTIGSYSTTQISAFGGISPSSLDWFIALGIISALIPPSIFYQLESRRKDAIDRNLPILLQDVAEAGSLGMTLIRAIEVSAERNYGPLTKELRKMAAQLSWRMPFDKALESFGERCGTLLAKRVAFFIQTAHKSGGEVQESIETINLHVQEFQNQERKRKMTMRPHIGVIYISFVVFLITAFFLMTQFFTASVGGLGLSGVDSAVGGFQNPTASKEIIAPVFFYMAMVEGFFSGLAGGKISSGTVKTGLVHSAILCSLSLIVFSLI